MKHPPFTHEDAAYYAKKGAGKSRGTRKSMVFGMEDIADACGISVRTLQRRQGRQCLLSYSLKELVEFINKNKKGEKNGHH